MEKLKRYLIFLVGLFVNSLGVSLITKANLGTSPISSIPYVLSLNFPFTLGNFTIFFSIFLIVLQLIILRKNFKLEHILQIPVSIIFGYFIDLTMILFSWVNPEAYIMKIVYLLIGCLILGVGVYMEVLADVVMLPGESFVRAIVLTWKTNFGTTKICFDVSMSVIAAVLSFVFAGRLAGVREGTVIAALLVGFIARLIGKKLVFLKDMIFPESVSAENENEAKEQTAGTYGKNVIAIGRQFGSGGHDIGKILAEKLGYDFYDAEIIQMTAGTTGYTPEFIKKNEEIMTNSLIYDLVNQMYLNADMQDEASVNQFLYTELIKLPQDELLGFDCAWQSYRNKANFPRMVAAACIINDGSSDDRFTDFRNWLIMQGYDAYRQALIDPDNLAALNIPFRDTEWMGCGNVAWYAYAGQKLHTYFEKEGIAAKLFRKYPALLKSSADLHQAIMQEQLALCRAPETEWERQMLRTEVKHYIDTSGLAYSYNEFYTQNMPDKVAWKTLQSDLFANLPQIKAERMPQDFSAVLPKLWRKRQVWDAERTKRPPYRGEER